MDMNTTYFFVGIKGTGMSALALILNDKGCNVLGSDIENIRLPNAGWNKPGLKFCLLIRIIFRRI